MCFFDVGAHRVRELERTLIGSAVDVHEHRRLTIEPGFLIGLGEAIHHGGNIAQLDPGSVATAHEHEIFVLASDVRLPFGPEQNFSTGGLDRASG